MPSRPNLHLCGRCGASRHFGGYGEIIPMMIAGTFRNLPKPNT